MNQNNISLEKVINGLKYHSEGNCFKSEDDETGCPYWKDSFCSQHLCSDALTLLKAQEPEAMDASKPDNDIGCWYDITHNYTLEQVVSALKAQEPKLDMADEGTKMTKSCLNCACYEEEWEYCFRLGTHVPKDGHCENYRNELPKGK